MNVGMVTSPNTLFLTEVNNYADTAFGRMRETMLYDEVMRRMALPLCAPRMYSSIAYSR
jgi:hypothetical protein